LAGWQGPKKPESLPTLSTQHSACISSPLSILQIDLFCLHSNHIRQVLLILQFALEAEKINHLSRFMLLENSRIQRDSRIQALSHYGLL
jgi:hypothetical protein